MLPVLHEYRGGPIKDKNLERREKVVLALLLTLHPSDQAKTQRRCYDNVRFIKICVQLYGSFDAEGYAYPKIIVHEAFLVTELLLVTLLIIDCLSVSKQIFNYRNCVASERSQNEDLAPCESEGRSGRP